jgi:hypothetical protein
MYDGTSLAAVMNLRKAEIVPPARECRIQSNTTIGAIKLCVVWFVG